jgi:hypothetical protein
MLTPNGWPIRPGRGLDADNFRRAQDSLRVLSAETIGLPRSIRTILERVDRTSREHRYILGVYPSNDRRDGKFRNVEVRVTRPGVTVRSRRGLLRRGAGSP